MESAIEEKTEGVKQLQVISPTIQQKIFSQETADGIIQYQIVDLGRQLYIWVSSGGAKLDNLYLAIKTPVDPMPALACVISGGASSEAGSLAQRLAMKLGKPVLCSISLPKNVPLLQVIAERRLLEEITKWA